jgi:hypothetical protein
MAKRQILGIALLGCAALVGGAATGRAADVLKVVPDNALGVVVIQNVGQADATIRQLAEQLQLPQVEMLRKLKSDLGLEQGIDDTGSVALAAIPAGDGTAPASVAFLPTDDYQALLRQLEAGSTADGITEVTAAGQPSVVAQRDGYAMITPQANRAALQAVLAMKRSIAEQTAALDDWRSGTLMYAVATPAGVEFAQQQILAGLAIAKQQILQAGPDAQQAMVGIEVWETLFKNLDREVTYAAAGLRVADDGDLHLVGRTLLAEGGVLAGMATGAQPGSEDLLAGLPKMPFVFAGGGVMTPEAVEPMMKASLNLMKVYPGGKDITPEQFQQIVQLSSRSMQGMRSMSMMLGVGRGDEPLYSSLYLVVKADNANQYLDSYLESVREMAKIFESTKFPFSYEVQPMQFEGRPGLKLSMGMSGMFGPQDVPGAEKMMELMFGSGDTMDVYMAVADDQTVVGAYVSRSNLVDLLESLEQGQDQLASMPEVAETIGEMDAGAHMIGLWSPQGTLAMVKRVALAMDPNAAVQIPELGATPPIGMAVQLSPNIVDTDVVIPAQVLKTVAALVQQLMPQGQPPQPQAY